MRDDSPREREKKTGPASGVWKKVDGSKDTDDRERHECTFSLNRRCCRQRPLLYILTLDAATAAASTTTTTAVVGACPVQSRNEQRARPRGWVQAQMFSPLSIDVIVRLTASSRPDTHSLLCRWKTDRSSLFSVLSLCVLLVSVVTIVCYSNTGVCKSVATSSSSSWTTVRFLFNETGDLNIWHENVLQENKRQRSSKDACPHS